MDQEIANRARRGPGFSELMLPDDDAEVQQLLREKQGQMPPTPSLCLCRLSNPI